MASENSREHAELTREVRNGADAGGQIELYRIWAIEKRENESIVGFIKSITETCSCRHWDISRNHYATILCEGKSASLGY
jgi:hypothetical protein